MADIKVTKEEFDKFIKNYPNRLEKDISGIFEPPLLTYNDFSSGRIWPNSVVAYAHLNEMMQGQGHSAYKGEPNDYYIKGIINV